VHQPLPPSTLQQPRTFESSEGAGSKSVRRDEDVSPFGATANHRPPDQQIKS